MVALSPKVISATFVFNIDDFDVALSRVLGVAHHLESLLGTLPALCTDTSDDYQQNLFSENDANENEATVISKLFANIESVYTLIQRKASFKFVIGPKFK